MGYSSIDTISTIRDELEQSPLIRGALFVPEGIAFDTLKGGTYRIKYQRGYLFVDYYSPSVKDYVCVASPDGVRDWSHREIVVMFMTTIGDIWTKRGNSFYMDEVKEIISKTSYFMGRHSCRT